MVIKAAEMIYYIFEVVEKNSSSLSLSLISVILYTMGCILVSKIVLKQILKYRKSPWSWTNFCDIRELPVKDHADCLSKTIPF